MVLMISGEACGWCRRIRPIYDKVCTDLNIEPKHIMAKDFDEEVLSVPCFVNDKGDKMYGGSHSYAELRKFFSPDK